jgi:hypothetical protein
MKKLMIGVISVMFIVTAIGCASLSSLITPATIDKQAVKYASEAGVIDSNDFEGYPNLDKATRLAQAVVAAYETNDLALSQLMEKNKLDYALLNDVVVRNRDEAVAIEEALFSPTGMLPVVFGMFGAGIPAGFWGLSRKRPQDWEPQEVEDALAESSIQLSDRERQIMELVKGVQQYIDNNVEGGTTLKSFLANVQSSDTKQLIGQLKATL